MAFNSKKWAGEMQAGLDDANSVTPSVIATARVLGVKPEVLAEALMAEEANSVYRNSVAQALQNLHIKQAVADEKEAKAK